MGIDDTKKVRLITDLEDRILWPYEFKVNYAKEKIREWYEYYDGKVVVSFSGGLDSTVLLHMVREIYPEVKAVFVNTGLEYPEIIEFVKTKSNVIWIRPDKSFYAIIKEYGYPVVSKQIAEYVGQVQRNIDTNPCSQVLRLRITGRTAQNKFQQQFMISEKWQYLIDAPFKVSNVCCKFMKKKPARKIQKELGLMPIVGTMASESKIRGMAYSFLGCNAYNVDSPRSAPLSVWVKNDTKRYVAENNLEYSKIYDMGWEGTGCMFCMYGVHIEHAKTGTNRFLRMEVTHPKLHKYCIEKLGIGEVLDYINVPYSKKQMPLHKQRRFFNVQLGKKIIDFKKDIIEREKENVL